MTDNIELTPEVREAFRRAGRRGGLTYAAQNDVHASTARARAAKAAKWLSGHGCEVCGPRIEVPADLPLEERQRRASALRKRHYTLLGERGGKR